MKARGAKRFAAAICVVAAILYALQLVLQIRNGFGEGASPYIFGVVALCGVAAFLAVGFLIVSRQPGNTIGWLLLALTFAFGLTAASGGWSTYALKTTNGGLPGGVYAAWISRWSLYATMVLFIPLFLLYPDGKVPTPRWRPVLWLTVAAMITATVSSALTPGPLTGGFGDPSLVENPFGLPAIQKLLDFLTHAGGTLAFACAIAAAVAIVRRFRRSQGDERQQIKWLAYVAVAFIATFVFSMILGSIAENHMSKQAADAFGEYSFLAVFTILVIGIPLACGVAILKYHLYDLDVIVKKTVVFGLLAVFITAVYFAIVAGVGTVVGSNADTLLSFAAAATLAIVFQPVRERARRLADRLVYGKRATPYEVLASFAGQVSEAYATEDVMPRMAQVLTSGTGAATAAVWLRVGAELRLGARHPAEESKGEPVPLAGDHLPEFAEGEHAVEVRHQGELLGALSVIMHPTDPMNPSRARLVQDLALQAELVLRNVRLIEELRASRQRLVAAQDTARRKIERDLHDGAQQQLVALAVQLKLAQGMAGKDAEKERHLIRLLRTAASDASENLESLARGIYPPLLAERGLMAALNTQAVGALVPTTVTGSVGRHPSEIEAAVYFCTLEALQNVAKYAEASRAVVTLREDDGELIFEVSDDGAGFDADAAAGGTGVQGMRDRLEAVGGRLLVTSARGAGTTVSGWAPTSGIGATR